MAVRAFKFLKLYKLHHGNYGFFFPNYKLCKHQDTIGKLQVILDPYWTIPDGAIHTGGLRTWNFQRYLRKNMWKFQGSIKKEVEFLGCSRKPYVEFPWVLVFDLGISKWCHTILQNFQGESLFSPEFLTVK